MKKLYPILFFLGLAISNFCLGQLTATFSTYESRCAATGSIKISATGGSGNYQYKAEGPVNSNYTTQDLITGLSSGIYRIIVNDVTTNKTFIQNGITVGGSYSDPRFSLSHMDVSCNNGSNGTIMVQDLQNGRPPFAYKIVAPSPMNVGESSPSGIFTGLKAGDYSIQLTDSCGGIQTRTVTINNYTWNISTSGFTKNTCDLASGYITVTDSRGANSKAAPIPGFIYGVVRTVGDTIWSADGNFNNITITGIRAVDVLAKDGCGFIKKVNLSLFLIPSLDANIKISNTVCNSFSATATNAANFFYPQYYLFDKNNTLISQNTTGIFNNIPYGSYCIKAHDGCTDSTISRCFTQKAPLASVGNNITISNKTCSGFSAAINNQQNLTNPQYCLVDSTGATVICNTTGKFNNVVYGKYCILIKDGCIDTTITRCFSVAKPIPRVNATITPAYVTCTTFGLRISGDSLTNPVYCLYDSNHNLVGSCNNTGTFDSIPLGKYTVSIHDNCADTTFIRDVNVGKPIIINNVNISVSAKNCTTFSATASGSLNNPSYCLFNSIDSSLITCNSSGIFTNLSYGNYYIKSKNACPDTTMINSFSVARDLPSVSKSVKITNKTCASFSAEITGQQNLVNAQYFLVVSASNDTLQRNNTGKFDNIPYSSYFVSILSGCNDTLKVPFTVTPILLAMNATASKSCYYGYSKFNVSITGTLPVNIKIFAPAGNLVKENNFNANNFTMDSLPELATGLSYTIIATDVCGNKNTVKVTPVVALLSHSPSVTAKCPGSVWPNGSGNILTTLNTNLPSPAVKIIKKDATTVNVSPTNVTGSIYTFNDLAPATYILKYTANDGCNANIYDTVVVSPYQFPDLKRSSAYQCDNNGFSVGAVVSNGVGPFTYQIFGSTPSSPSLVAPPQSSPVFNINNGATYSLIRLRALDACGNATLGDASILPLVNNGIKATLNCFLSPSTLSVDTIYNATYQWFKKTSAASADSVAVSNGYNYFIPEVLPTDTGVYVCHITVNNGCVQRTYYFHLDGSCRLFLPLTIENFSGKLIDETVLLSWKINSPGNVKQIIAEKKTKNNFVEIGNVPVHLPSENNLYQFLDSNAANNNFYRIKIIKNDNTFSYSNIIFIQKKIVSNISIYPNPASDFLNIGFYQSNGHVYKISLINVLNQKLKEIIVKTKTEKRIQIKRTKEMLAGIYFLHFTDLNTNEQFSKKIIFDSK